MRPDLMGMSESALIGTVVAVQANYYRVQLQDGHRLPTDILLCIRRGRLKKVGQQVMVGDWVLVEDPDWEGGRGAIAAVKPRQSQLDRPPVANANQVLLVFALAEPDLDPHQLTRFLVKAELTGLSVQLCLNKRDLITPETQGTWLTRLTNWGYAPILLSVEQDKDFAALMTTLENCVTVVSGPSGVGKSSLINRLIPAIDLRTNAVSGRLGKGRHTTRHTELFELPNGGLLADTPGFNQPDIACSPAALAGCFPEIKHQLQGAQCQFTDCLHQGEPGCAIAHSWERYPLYLDLLTDCQAQHQALNDSANPEAAFKVKTGEDGKAEPEPRLTAKKYRRPSRRSRKQTLQDLRYEFLGNLTTLETLESEEDEADY